MDPEEWRSHIAYIGQQDSLISGNVMENIRYGSPGASDEQVISAAVKAHADSFIQELPEAYDSDVGEMGNRLSGGQRQRIALARAFLIDPKILLLDEATNALDVESELSVEKALKEFAFDGSRTTLVIAHSLATAMQADAIVVVDSGKIVGIGDHMALVSQCDSYRELFNIDQGA